MTNIQEHPDTPMSILELFNTSKDSIRLFSDMVIDQVKEGHADPLRVKALCKSMEAIAEAIDKNTRDEQKKEAAKFGDKPFMNFGCEMHYTSVKTDYDYTTTNDPIWGKLKRQIESLTIQLRQREAWLKLMGNPEDIRIDDELVTIYPPIKKTQLGVKVTIK